MKPRKISPVVQKAVEHYASEARSLIKSSDNAKLNALREQALARFETSALPNQRDEDWQYTRLTGFVQDHFHIQPSAQITSEQVKQFLPSFAVTKVVFVDGWFSEALSDDLSSLPKTAYFETFVDVVDDGGDCTKLFAIEDEVAKEPFANLNSCLATDGFYLQLEANSHLEMPIFVLHIQTNSNQSSHTRNRISVGENAELTLVERYVSLDAESTFTNVVTHLDIAKHARVKQIVMQEQVEAAYYFNNQYIYQAESSQFNTFYGSMGSQIARHQNHLWMNGEHIESEQNSACLAKNKQVVDSRTDTQHNDVWGQSHQLHKYVLTDTATGVFNGMIRVDQKAQKTDGQMDNKNLILSNDAKMDTKPQLEIYADDVKCSHGSATGQIDANQIFYLQARGINREDAIKMITHAFLLEPTESISKDEIRTWVNNLLSAGLAKLHG